MPLLTTKSLPDAALVAVRALFNFSVLEQTKEMYYEQLGYRDYEPEAPDETANNWSGPGNATLTTEGVQYGDNTKYAGLKKIAVLLKSFLIYGENPVAGNALQAAL